MDHLEPFRISFKAFEKIPCFPENLVTEKISLRICYDSYIGIFRPFGTISEVLKKVPRNVPRKVPSFRVFQNPLTIRRVASHQYHSSMRCTCVLYEDLPESPPGIDVYVVYE